MHSRHRSTNSPHKPSRHTSSSSAPLSTLDESIVVPSGAHSLAHELAVALMPEPAGGGTTSRLLAEEFGIEYDEGAEGIDGDLGGRQGNGDMDPLEAKLDDVESRGASLADELGGSEFEEGPAEEMGGDGLEPNGGEGDERSPGGGSDDGDDDATRRAALALDAMEILSQNLASTDRFLAHLRIMDVPPSSATGQTTSSSTFTIEGLASDIIRRINNAVREREVQLRELIAHDRDFKRISVEVGGTDVLGGLESLPDVDEPESPRLFNSATQPDPLMAVAVPSLADLRVNTASLLSSLATISEQAQVDGAATTDAGRKIRSLKNRLGGWKAEWEAAERSQTRIQMWEAESKALGRIDGRTVVKEHMLAFGKAVEEAGLKTRAIMAR